MPALIVTNSNLRTSRPARLAGKLFSSKPFHWLRRRELKRVTPHLAKNSYLYVDSDKLEYANVSTYGKRTEWTTILATQLAALKIERIIISNERDAAAVANFINAAEKSLPPAEEGKIEIADLATEEGRRDFITSDLTTLNDIRITFNNLRKAERGEVFKSLPSEEKIDLMAHSNIYKRGNLVEFLSTEEKCEVIDRILARLSKIESGGLNDLSLLHKLLKDENLGYDTAKLKSIQKTMDEYNERNKAYNLRKAAEESATRTEALDPDDFKGTGATPPHKAGGLGL